MPCDRPCSPASDTILPQAIRGEAFDRHLLGLKLQAIEDLVSMPDIFMDTSYAIAMHFNLSTSQVGRWPRSPRTQENRTHWQGLERWLRALAVLPKDPRFSSQYPHQVVYKHL